MTSRTRIRQIAGPMLIGGSLLIALHSLAAHAEAQVPTDAMPQVNYNAPGWCTPAANILNPYKEPLRQAYAKLPSQAKIQANAALDGLTWLVPCAQQANQIDASNLVVVTHTTDASIPANQIGNCHARRHLQAIAYQWPDVTDGLIEAAMQTYDGHNLDIVSVRESTHVCYSVRVFADTNPKTHLPTYRISVFGVGHYAAATASFVQTYEMHAIPDAQDVQSKVQETAATFDAATP